MLVKEFEAILQDFAETGNLSQFFKSAYEVTPAMEFTGVNVKLFSLEKLANE